MARGTYLRDVIVPLVAAHIDYLDDHVSERFRAMCERYRLPLPPEAPTRPVKGA
jgi:hypothetical protein